VVDENPENFGDMVEAARRSRSPTMAERVSLCQARELREAEVRAQTISRVETETWELVSKVCQTLLVERIAPESDLLGGRDLKRYIQSKESTGGPFAFIGHLRQDRLAERAIGAWDLATKLTTPARVQESTFTLEHDLFLGADGRIYAFRGMTDREHERGVLIPQFAREPRKALPFDHQYEEIQRGLANVVARYDLQV
jgi:hypothetical protein